MHFHVLTLFPNIFSSFLSESLLSKALSKKLLQIDIIDIRNYTSDPHRTADDRPYGGGPGMVLKPEPIAAALDEIIARNTPNPLVITLSPGGAPFTQKLARELCSKKTVVLICGRYEGIDQRVTDLYSDLELSMGDYILNGGEVPAMAVIEAVSRLIPGFIGEAESAEDDSFSSGLLEYPQYTRPQVWKWISVPDTLLSGNHREIETFRKSEALKRTKKYRPDLINPDKE